MRTDQPWLDIHRRHRQPKPPRLVEEEVAPGRILFGPGRRQWLAILGTVFGLGGAGATLGGTALRGANAVAIGQTSGAPNPFVGDCLLLIDWCGGPQPVDEVAGPNLLAILPAGRRLDPTQ